MRNEKEKYYSPIIAGVVSAAFSNMSSPSQPQRANHSLLRTCNMVTFKKKDL